jgi:hypothetical protein
MVVFLAFESFIIISPQIALGLTHLNINSNLMIADRRNVLVSLRFIQKNTKDLVEGVIKAHQKSSEMVLKEARSAIKLV